MYKKLFILLTAITATALYGQEKQEQLSWFGVISHLKDIKSVTSDTAFGMTNFNQAVAGLKEVGNDPGFNNALATLAKAGENWEKAGIALSVPAMGRLLGLYGIGIYCTWYGIQNIIKILEKSESSTTIPENTKKTNFLIKNRKILANLASLLIGSGLLAYSHKF